jgi:hypothetical protein
MLPNGPGPQVVHDRDAVRREAPFARQRGLVHAVDDLHLEKVVAAEVEPHLTASERGRPQEQRHERLPRLGVLRQGEAARPFHPIGERAGVARRSRIPRGSTLERGAAHLLAGQAVAVAVEHVARGIAVHRVEERERPLGRDFARLEIGQDEPHAVVDRDRRELGNDRVERRDRDARRHLGVGLLVEIGQGERRTRPRAGSAIRSSSRSKGSSGRESTLEPPRGGVRHARGRCGLFRASWRHDPARGERLEHTLQDAHLACGQRVRPVERQQVRDCRGRRHDHG